MGTAPPLPAIAPATPSTYAHIHTIDRLTVDPDLDFNIGVLLRNADRVLLSKVNDSVASLVSSGEIERIFSTTVSSTVRPCEEGEQREPGPATSPTERCSCDY